MSAFKQRLARIGASTGMLAVATAAILAVGGASASSAFACPTGTLGIQGKGSSLQRIAQEQWTGRKVPTVEEGLPHEALSPATGYASACSGAPVSYTSTSSGNGLKALRFTGTGAIETAFAFVGSDDGPNTTQIANAEGAAGGAKPVIVPVAETSIAVVVHPPTNCTIRTGLTHGLTYAELNEVFNGTITTWKALGTNVVSETSGGCESPITRVVRAEGSGTTFQFKNYLSALETNASILAPGPGCSLGTWASQEEIGTEEKPNITWPTCSGTSALTSKAGGGAVAEYVKNTAGTIGYAALPDAKGKGAAVIRLKDSSSAEYALPESGTASNCGTRQYTIPSSTTGIAADWSKVFGASPFANSELYPLCTLTYDVAWHGYSSAGYSSAAETAAAVKSYLEYEIGTGQSSLSSNYYQAIPSTPTEPTHDVKAAAVLAAGAIN
jgi:phosphate transport system substrate-binding protein